MIANGQTIVQFMEQLAPKQYAFVDDPIGLQLGVLNKPVSQVLIALDVTPDVVSEAIDMQAELIIAHHAILYRPIKHLRMDLPAGKLYESLIKNDIAVYIAHTNLDVATGGVNDILANMLGLEHLSFLQEVRPDQGIGRVGKLPKHQLLSEFINTVKIAYDIPAVRFVGDPNRMIRKVAVLGGSGRDYVKAAIFAGADVLITGDIDYHTAHDALAAGMNIIDAGHNIEKLLKPAVANILQEKLRKGRYVTKVSPSELNTEPFQFM
ncbi:MAG: Nif3-like dinuclear metal center hexameric protein [Paenibacillaceae bacterium]